MIITIDEESQGIGRRLDVFVVSHYPEISRASIQKLIEQNKIMLNDKETKPGYKLRFGDVLSVEYEPLDYSLIPEIELPILYDDEDCVVINKPVGILTHSKGSFNPEATVATFMSSRLKDMGGDRGGIVHRLDRATSGVIICAKHADALSMLQKQFSQRKTKKTYNAVITGTIDPTEAIIDMPIERNPKHPQTFRVGSQGRSALTAYKVLSTNQAHTLLELKPTTGRTHQIRVHLAKQNRPIVGDVLYGGEPADRMYLHALSLEITLPSSERMTFTAALPESFNALTA